MNLDSILDRLWGVRRSGRGFKARCPAHEDRIASLSVTPSDDGKILLYCHAGCSYSEILEALSEGEALQETATSNELAGSLLGSSSSESAPRPATLDGFYAVYDYQDERGVLLFKVCRTHDKRFFQCRPDADSPTGFFWGLGEVRRVPYRLPRVLRAVEAGETVYIVEGEKDVHAIERAGGTATCNPMGASKGKSKWRKEWNDYFRDATVVIVRDDDETGLIHALDVRDNILTVTDRVMLVVAAQGKDAYDHLQAGYGLYDFLVI